MLNWLLALVPVTIALEHLAPERHSFIFIGSAIAILPLAAWMGRATEQLAERMGEGVGGLLNATFGNAAELIIALAALRAGLHDVVKASIAGSIVGNILLVLGAAMLAGGLRYKEQSYNAQGARSQATMLTLAAIALILPAAYQAGLGIGASQGLGALSVSISIVLLAVYVLFLVFSLVTHPSRFAGSHEIADGDGHQPWPIRRSVSILATATIFVAWMSEIMVRCHRADRSQSRSQQRLCRGIRGSNPWQCRRTRDSDHRRRQKSHGPFTVDRNWFQRAGSLVCRPLARPRQPLCWSRCDGSGVAGRTGAYNPALRPGDCANRRRRAFGLAQGGTTARGLPGPWHYVLLLACGNRRLAGCIRQEAMAPRWRRPPSATGEPPLRFRWCTTSAGLARGRDGAASRLRTIREPRGAIARRVRRCTFGFGEHDERTRQRILQNASSRYVRCSRLVE